MLSVPALLLATATLGILHMSAPDHWVTLVILGRASGWSTKKLVTVSLVTALGHVALSVILGIGVVLLGLALTSAISVYLTEGIGAVMLVAGLAYAGSVILSPQDADYQSIAAREASTFQGPGARVRYFAVLGAALSPDLSILPIFLIAIPVGLGLAFEVSAVFAVSSILALIALVAVGSASLAKAFEKIPSKYNDALVGLTIAVVGLYIVLAG